MNIREEQDEGALITSYFQQGYTNIEILEFLKLHGIELSLSIFKRRLQCFDLRRRQQPEEAPQEEMEHLIRQELAGSSCNVGYRKCGNN